MSCPTGKIQYAVDAEAENAAFWERDRLREPTIQAYRCRLCGQWHVGKYDKVKHIGRIPSAPAPKLKDLK